MMASHKSHLLQSCFRHHLCLTFVLVLMGNLLLSLLFLFFYCSSLLLLTLHSRLLFSTFFFFFFALLVILLRLSSFSLLRLSIFWPAQS